MLQKHNMSQKVQTKFENLLQTVLQKLYQQTLTVKLLT